MILIADVDNCISNDEHRISFIDWDASHPDSRYHQYHMRCVFDTPANLDILDQYDQVHLFTAMPELYAPMRFDWLDKHRVRYDSIVFRTNGDQRPSPDIKRDMCRALIDDLDGRHPDMAIDDRHEVLAMYSMDFEIKTQLIKIHDTCAYTQPRKRA